MLELKVNDEDRTVALQFEHSLLSLSKWESRTQKPFLSSERDSMDMIDYFQDMLLTEVDPSIVYRLSPEQLEELTNYVNADLTASSVSDGKGKGVRETVTSELIYYWMVALNIDWAAERWHLSRLMMLVRIANYKQQPETKKSQAEQVKSWQQINEENQRRFGAEA